jgi:NAD(P) transhydrogenase
MKTMGEDSFDLVVIGAGPAGEKGAVTAAVFGKRVAIVEKEAQVGGAVANTGTLPSKTLRETALALSGWKARRLHGVDLSLRREATVADLMHHEKQVAAQERQRILQYLSNAGVVLHHGSASFLDSHTLRVTSPAGERVLRAEKVLIATGSAPQRPPEFSFEDPRICDSDEILHLKCLPQRLAVVGGGVIGSEYACTFAALGVQVHLVDGRDQLLPFLDAEVSTALADSMQKLGIQFHWKERVVACEAPRGGGEVTLRLTSGGALAVDTVLVAAGRVSRTADLQLEAAGVTVGKRGLIPVDKNYQTNVPHIYAAGDVIGFPALAATGMEQARVAMSHAFDLGFKAEVSPMLPNGIYTIPEVSMVGESEESAKEKGIECVVGKALYRENARGVIVGDRSGFLKLLFRRDDMRLVGVHAIGEQASELVHVGLVAMLSGATWELFNRICFNYPTLGLLYQRATYDAAFRRAEEAGLVKPLPPTGGSPKPTA